MILLSLSGGKVFELFVALPVKELLTDYLLHVIVMPTFFQALDKTKTGKRLSSPSQFFVVFYHLTVV